MSAARHPRQRSAEPASPAPADIAALRARRRQARRRRRLARVDVVLGGAAAVALLLASPGLAIAGLVAVLLIVACAVSVLLERRARRRTGRRGKVSEYSSPHRDISRQAVSIHDANIRQGGSWDHET